MTTPEINPYHPLMVADEDRCERAGWIRPLLVLNAILLALPTAIVMFIYAVIQIELARQTGKSVSYETELTAISGPWWPVLLYWIVPNAMLVIHLAMRTRLLHKS